ncbi:hypothetical protein TSOC_013547 [Tetrabaena socialis]|uniref:Uncharacterized protein n=1 Tax=Tetrabaena socialis TaxID=47790 RepID=A0A2J7ZK26_9CHLO|nr:hypothetical protein TSOC_013547 [Tetrabaena socialis]|eukprot:PNH00625.1 hypothetical protein TSOC_013547 [Tetrabaena socialis]
MLEAGMSGHSLTGACTRVASGFFDLPVMSVAVLAMLVALATATPLPNFPSPDSRSLADWLQAGASSAAAQISHQLRFSSFASANLLSPATPQPSPATPPPPASGQ